MGRVWHPLRRPAFRKLWVGQAVSAIGDQLSIVAFAALVIAAGHGAGGLGIVLAARSLGLVVFIPAGGIIGDRLRRSRVMIGADVVRVAATIALALPRRHRGARLAARDRGRRRDGGRAGRGPPRLPGLVAMLALLPSAFTLLVLIGPAPLVVVALSVLVGGAGEAVFDIYWNSCVQRDVPDRLLARVFSLDFFGSLALMPLGYALTGPAVDALGRDAVLVFGAVVVVVTLVPLLAIPSVRAFSSRPPVTDQA